MKTKLLTLFSLLALLLVSTVVMADGRPTGIRIGRLVSGGGTNVQLDITVPGTDFYYESFNTEVWIGNTLRNRGFSSFEVYQWSSSSRSVPLPWAIDWGDSYFRGDALLLGPPGGPFVGTFSHTYVTPGTYTVTAGDALCCSTIILFPTKQELAGKGPALSPTVTTGNAITGTARYINTGWDPITDTWYYSTTPAILAVTANATVNTGTGIPTLNIYGLLAMAFVLVGTGVLLFRRPQQA